MISLSPFITDYADKNHPCGTEGCGLPHANQAAVTGNLFQCWAIFFLQKDFKIMQSNPIDDKPLYRRGYDIMQGTLSSEFTLKTSPIAVKFFYSPIEIEHFKKWHDYTSPVDLSSFFAAEDIAHTTAKILLIEKSSLSCETALSHFNWQQDQSTKPKQQLQPGLLAIAIAPLKDALYVADTIHFLCSQEQAKNILTEWQGVAGVGPLTEVMEDTPSCEACVAVHNENLAARVDSGQKNSEGDGLHVRVILPADHIKHLVDGINERKISLGPSSLSRPGDGFFRISLG